MYKWYEKYDNILFWIHAIFKYQSYKFVGDSDGGIYF